MTFKALALKLRDEIPNDPEKAMAVLLGEMLKSTTKKDVKRGR
ncbi:hypothetical protein ACFFWD_31435 [Bradyrhizobium erythrophlei]